MKFFRKLRSKRRTLSLTAFFAVFFTVLCAVCGDVGCAEAATYTYDCPSDGFTELITSKTGYVNLGSSSTYSTSTTTKVSVFKDEFFDFGVPSAGDTFQKDDLYGKQTTLLKVKTYNAKCPACEKYASVNYSTGSITAGSSASSYPAIVFDEDIEGYYIISIKYVSTSASYRVVSVASLKDYLASTSVSVVGSSGGTTTKVAMYSGVQTASHTYSVTHSCSDKCKERLHTHVTKWDETEYEYTCDCTTTNYVSWSGTLSSSESSCGHTSNYLWREYYCRQCGERLGTTYRDGCSNSSCWNYYKDLDYYTEFVHPGEHTYTAKGIRKLCTCTNIVKDGYRDSYGYDYRAVCEQCGTVMYEYYTGIGYAGDYNCTISTAASSYSHYYYVRDEFPDSCYAYDQDNIHSASSLTSSVDRYKWNCGHKTITCTTTTYSCNKCGSSIYDKYTETGCSACGFSAVSETYENFDSKNSYLIGELSCYFYDGKTDTDTETINKYVLHMPKTLVCTESEYGEKICDKIVTKLIPIEDSQTVMAGEGINTTAYATFLDGHIEIVTCSLSGLNQSLFNTWQTATLSYGMYSAADNRNPRTTEIQVYLECTDFDLTVTSENSEYGTLSGTGTYTNGTEVTVSATANAGYTFDGWYDGDTKVSSDAVYTFSMPARHLTLTAKFTANSYTLTVVSESDVKGSVTGGGTVTYKNSVTVTATPKTGFSFLGWYQDAKKVSSGATYTLAMPAHDVKLIAKFVGKELTVSFNSNGGSACSSIKANYLSAYGKLPVPIRSGYTFLGWTYNNNYVSEVSPVSVNANHTLTAVWAEVGPEFLLIKFGDAYKVNSYGKLPTPSKRGYDFLNWFKTENVLGNGDSLGVDSNIVLPDTLMMTAENHTLHAGWKEKSFTLSFNSNGGSACPNMIITYDRKYGYSKPLPTPTKSGYTFTGWYVSNVGGNGDGTQITNASRVQVLSDQTLYAGWTQDAVELTVHFEARTEEQAGLTADESKSLGYGSTIGTLTGSADCTVTYPGTYGNYELTWCNCTDAAHNTLPKYGGRHYIVDYTSSYDALPVPVRTGYTFTGWKYGETAVTDKTNTLAAFEHTVFATYTPNTYTVVIDGRGATSLPQISVTATFDAGLPEVSVPEKTGYTFLGYYTGTKGNGVKYYDENGHGVREWLSDSITVTKLYAYWTQNDVHRPEEGDRDDPDVEAEESITKNIRKEGADTVLLYADDYNDATGALTDVQPYLTYTIMNGASVRAEGAIPSTEKLAIRAKTGAWMLSYTLNKLTGKDYVRYYVTVPYRTQYEKDDESLVISEQKTKTYSFLVPKVWAYYAVANGGVYYPDTIDVSNQAIVDGKATVVVNNSATGSVSKPSYHISTYGDKEGHVSWAAGLDSDGVPKSEIVLTEEQYLISTTVGVLPDIDAILSVIAENAAWLDVTQFTVKSDQFEVAGVTILSDAEQTNGKGLYVEEVEDSVWQTLIPEISYEQSYLSGIDLIDTIGNGTYTSTAVINYVADTDNAPADSIPSATVKNVNSVTIHTPVACDGQISIDGAVYGEYRSVASAGGLQNDMAVLPLTDSFNEFTVSIYDIGLHKLMLGYGEKDFSTALSGASNLALFGGSTPFLAVRFPFDVYVDTGNDSRKTDGSFVTTGDKFYKANSWIVIGDVSQKFYVPATAATGDYTVDFISVAVNCPKDGSGNFLLSGLTQAGANTLPERYVATDSIKMRIEGCITDISITGTNDLSAADRLAVGLEALTLKKGYSFGFKVSTIGLNFMENNASVVVKPSFYYVTENGERIAADVYYSEYFNGKSNYFVKVGDTLDAQNLHSYSNRSIYADNSLLEKTKAAASLDDFIGKVSTMFSFGNITLGGYTRMLPGLPVELPAVYCASDHIAYLRTEGYFCSHTEFLSTASTTGSAKAVQEWYGIYYIPDTALVITEGTLQGYCAVCGKIRYTVDGTALCPNHRVALSSVKTFDFTEYLSKATVTGKEEFFRNNGTLVVNFDVTARAEGNVYKFKKWTDTDIARDFLGQDFTYSAGDIVLYDLGKSAKDDYEVGGSE